MFLQARRIAFLSLALSLFVSAGIFSFSDAMAQSRGSVLSRINAMEDRLNKLQTSPADETVGSGQTQVDLSHMREELRGLRGDVEELSHIQRRQKEQLEQLTREMDLRFSELKQTAAKAAETAEETIVEEAPADTTNPEEDYKLAFETLNKGDYVSAEQQFGAFITRHPEHSLIGNAHYWLGETYYVQEQFDAAADEFRQGFQAMPQGSKAPDNLLRLGMSLGVLERKKEACVILKQLLNKYAAKSKAVERKANHERDKLGCK